MCLKSGETRKDLNVRSRRRKRDREGEYVLEARRETVVTTTITTKKAKKKSNSLKKHGADGPSGGVEALLPSLIGLAILGFGLMAKMGFRGRASVAGIDLGTTNSVICVQAPAKGGTFFLCAHANCLLLLTHSVMQWERLTAYLID